MGYSAGKWELQIITPNPNRDGPKSLNHKIINNDELILKCHEERERDDSHYWREKFEKENQ